MIGYWSKSEDPMRSTWSGCNSSKYIALTILLCESIINHVLSMIILAKYSDHLSCEKSS